jgi:hypothetical protein
MIQSSESFKGSGNSFPWLSALVAYFCSFGLVVLFWNSYFWDDWYVYFGSSRNELARWFTERGDWPSRVFVEWNLLRFNPVLFRLSMLLAFFIAAWCLFHILKTLDFVRRDQASFATLVFLILPINSARVSMATFAYALSFLLFFIAWLTLVKSLRLFGFLCALSLFVFSFASTASLLVFLYLPTAHFCYLNLVREGDRKFIDWTKAIVLVSTPLTYWFFDRWINPPRGVFASQYSVQIVGVVRVGFTFFAVLAIWVLVSLRQSGVRQPFLIPLIGITAVMLGAAPYIVAGHLFDLSSWIENFVPRASEWDSRHQLLLGLGISLILVGLSDFIQDAYRSFYRILILLICVSLNFTFMQAYFLDAKKQDEVIEQFAKIDLLKTNSQILILDDAVRFNARGRALRSWEWEAMLDKSQASNNNYLVEPLRYVSCDGFKPTLILTVVATNGRLESLITRDLGIEVRVEEISPCE